MGRQAERVGRAGAVPVDVDAVRSQFPALAETDAGLPRTFFDNPAGTQVPLAVVERMAECLIGANANLGGYFRTSRLAGEVVDGALRAMADLLNAPSADEIVFGQNMTSLTFHISRSIGRSLRSGDEIILSRMDHDANVQPWVLLARDHDLRVRWLPMDTETFEFDLDEFDTLLNERTRLVCVGAASNLTGTINDIDELCRRARDAGAWTYVDAVQSVPHVLGDVQRTGCDFFVCSAYKFFGPHQGILWGRRDLLERLEPYKVRPAPDTLPWAFAPGTASHEGMAGTAAAVDYLASIGGSPADDGTGRRRRLERAFDAIGRYELGLSRRLLDGLGSIPEVTVHGITADDALRRRVPTVAFTHARRSPAEVAGALAERDIFVWSGHNYAVEATKSLGVLDKGGVIRVGLVHYNTAAEVDRLLDALPAVLR